MSIESVRRTAVLLVTVAANYLLVASLPAQPPRLTADEPAEVRRAPPRADREPGYLGLVTDDRRDQGEGVRVVKVVENSPAAAAGITVDDLIVAIDGQPTGSLDAMATELQSHPAGDKVRFEIRRAGMTQTVEVALAHRPARGERPFEFGRIPERLPEPQGAIPPVGDAAILGGVPPPGSGAAPPAARGQLLGIRTAPITEEVRQRLRLPDAAGARVVSRVVGSPAERAGIPLESIIVAVDEQAVASPADLARLIAAAGAGKVVELSYIAAGQQRSVRVTLADDVSRMNAMPPGEPKSSPRPLDAQFAPPPSAAVRIEQLEHRIGELELRVQELEKALASSPAKSRE